MKYFLYHLQESIIIFILLLYLQCFSTYKKFVDRFFFLTVWDLLHFSNDQLHFFYFISDGCSYIFKHFFQFPKISLCEFIAFLKAIKQQVHYMHFKSVGEKIYWKYFVISVIGDIRNASAMKNFRLFTVAREINV